MMRAMLRDMLEDAGHRIIEAGTSEDGVRLYREQPTDIVITDLFIPSKGGLEIIKELTQDYPDVKIVAISGVDVSGTGYRHDIDPKELAVRCGAKLSLKKPFSKAEILSAIDELVG